MISLPSLSYHEYSAPKALLPELSLLYPSTWYMLPRTVLYALLQDT